MSTYNGEKYIEQQLDSIFTPPKNIFLYVRDDGSKDRTIEILKDYGIKHAVPIEVNEGKNVGSAESFLTALRDCPKADYYAFCDQDDVWINGKLSVASEQIGATNQPVLWCSDYQVTDSDLRVMIPSVLKQPVQDSVRAVFYNNVPGCTMVFNWALMQELRKVNISNIRMHDIMAINVALITGKVIFDKTPYVLYRQHGNNVLGYSHKKIQIGKWIKEKLELIRNKDIVGYTIASTFFSTFGSVIAIYLFPEHKAYARIYAMVLVHIVIYSVVYYKIMRTGRKTVWKEAWKYALHYNIPLIPHYLSQQVLNQADRLMINRMCGSAQTAIYTVAYQIAMVLNIVTTAIESSFTPWAYQKISEGKENEVGKIAQSILIVTGITCLFFTLFAPEFIYLLGGNAYQSAIWVVPPVCMSVYFIMMYSLISTVTFYYEKTKSIMLASCAIAVLNIILNQYFITIYGMVAAGYTTLVCYICYALVHYLLMCHVSKDKKKQNPFNIGIIWIPAVLFVFLAVVSSLSYTHLKLRILLMVLLGGLLIFVAYKNKSNLLKLMKK